jgi:hypothetical protein
MSARHPHRQRGGLWGLRFAEKLASWYGLEGCRLPRSERLALLEAELAKLDEGRAWPNFSDEAIFFMIGVLLERSDAEYAAAAQKKRVRYHSHVDSGWAARNQR